jgi:hypothetical protein
MHLSQLIPLAICVSLLGIAGCAPKGPKTYPVAGEVTFDGQPVAEGEIIFRAADGAQGSWAAKITGGSYALESTAGAKRVEITAHRQIEVAPSASGEGGINYEMYIPEKYNEKSDLTREVTPAGPNKFDFPLEP